MVAMIFEDGTQSTHTYDVLDNRLTSTDANGSVVTNTYDLLNRVTGRSVTTGTGVADDITFEVFKYDGLSRLVYAEDDDSVVVRKYDSLSNLSSDSVSIDSASAEIATATYDGQGNRLTLTYPGGRVVSATYDELNRMSSLSDQVGTIADYAYFGRRRAEQIDLGNDTRTSFDYDGIRRIVGMTHTFDPEGTPATLDDRSFTWDQMSNKTSRTDEVESVTHNYVYDSTYRMIESDIGGSSTREYSLDSVGNRTSVSGSGGGSYHMLSFAPSPPQDDEMNQYSETPLSRREDDENGNLIRIAVAGDYDGDGDIDLVDWGTFNTCYTGNGVAANFECRRFDFDRDGDVDMIDFGTFQTVYTGSTGSLPASQISYDYRNQMVEVNDLQFDERHIYGYDALGRRIFKIVNVDTSPVETRFLCFDHQMLEETDEYGATIASYVYGGRYIDAVLTMRRDVDSDTNFEDYYYHADDLFNTMAVSDEAGDVVERYEYGDYGTPEFRDAAGVALTSGTSAIDNPLLFNSRYFDAETGWYYYRVLVQRKLERRVTRPIEFSPSEACVF